jgi:hypothetical protein
MSIGSRTRLAGGAIAAILLSSAPAWASSCIPSDRIDHTSVQDDQTVLFYMRDHTVWQNTLDGKCVGLKLDPGGFTYNVTVPETHKLCSRETIRLNHTGQPCLLGEFAQLAPAKG